MVFPAGIRNNAQCFVLSSFAKDANGVINREFTSIVPRISMLNNTDFVLGSAGGVLDEYYCFKGKFLNDGEEIELDMLDPNEEFCTKIQLTKEYKSRK
ncbi:hypothetical protein RHS04_06903 [Rhizoctonia solani]